MKAAVRDRYGSPDAVVVLREIDRPVAADDEVLVRVHAASVNPADWYGVTGTPYVGRVELGLRKPKERRLGVDFAGTVEAVGTEVTQFRPGDDVFGWCAGSFAEYASGPEDHFVAKPAQMTYEEAAAVPVAAVTALQALRDVGKLHSGQSVLINGAAGGVGTFAVQIAKSLGAEVTGVCSSRNVDLVKSLGADHVIDYTGQDFTKGAQRYDLILDNAGSQSLAALRGVLSSGGTVVYNSGASMGRMAGAMLLSRTGRKVFTFLARLNQADLVVLRDLIEAGKLRSVIDRTYPLQDAGGAIAYVEAGHARGKVVVTV